MKSLLLVLILSVTVLATEIDLSVLNEALEIFRTLRYAGCIAESEVLSAKLNVTILTRMGTVEPIDRMRLYRAYRKYLQMKEWREELAFKYNWVIRLLNYARIDIPEGIPIHIELEEDSWGYIMQY